MRGKKAPLYHAKIIFGYHLEKKSHNQQLNNWTNAPVFKLSNGYLIILRKLYEASLVAHW